MDLDEIFSGLRETRQPRNGKTRVYARHGATIGDGMQTAARVGGWTAFAALLLNSAPILIAALAGLIFMVRGCLVSTFETSTPERPVASQQPLPPTSPLTSIPLNPRPAAAIEPRGIASNGSGRTVGLPLQQESNADPTRSDEISWRREIADRIAEPHHQANADVSVHSPKIDELSGLAPPGYLPEQFGLARPFAGTLWTSPNDVGNGLENTVGPFGFPAAGDVMGMGFTGQEFGMTQRVAGRGLAADYTSPEIGQIEASPLFDTRKGRKYTGTSQQPGQQSYRISLSVDLIREHGSNMRARLSLLEGSRITKPFDGFLDDDGRSMTLVPITNPGSFGTFLTHMPWHSQSPTRITLEILGDGKRLTGKSYSGERFELTEDDSAQQRASKGHESTQPTALVELGGASSDGKIWDVVRRNGVELSPNEKTSWLFFNEKDRSGTIEWLRGGNEIASGTYKDYGNGRDLDINIIRGEKVDTYRGFFMALLNDPGSIRIVIPKLPGVERITSMNGDLCNRFDLKLRPIN